MYLPAGDPAADRDVRHLFRSYHPCASPVYLPRISPQEIPLHTVMRITYDGWNPPREVRILLVLLGVGVGVGVGTRRTRCASS